MEITFFPNGGTIAFDDSGNQVPEVQRSWLLLYADFLEEQGYTATGHRFRLPGGLHARIVERPPEFVDHPGQRYNWEIQ